MRVIGISVKIKIIIANLSLQDEISRKKGDTQAPSPKVA